MSDRSHILSHLSSRLAGPSEATGLSSDLSDRQKLVSQHLRNNRRAIVPQRTNLSHNNLVKLFMTEAKRSDASCELVSSFSAIPKAVAGYVKKHGLQADLWVSEQSEVAELLWEDADLHVTGSENFRDGLVGVNMAYGGVAETGSLAFVSSSDLALSQNFLSAYHIVVLQRGDIVGCYEDIRERLGNKFKGHRGLIFVTGPSRTADIAQTLELGAHGALQLHILVVDE